MNASPKPKAKNFPRWGFIVVALLAGHVTLMMTAVTFALRGYSSAGVEPDYYARAVAWDADQQLLRDSESLGWLVTITPDIWLDHDGRRKLTVNVRDELGQPIDHADVALVMHHAVYTQRKADATLNHQGNGAYAAKLAGLTPGLWRIDARVVVPGNDPDAPTQWFGQFDQQIADVVTPATPTP